MLNKCSKLTQKDYKTRHNWVIHLELWKKKNEIWVYKQMVYAKTMFPKKWDA